MPLFRRRHEPTPVAHNPYERAGAGSDPAPYVSENDKGWAPKPEPLQSQWRRLAVVNRSHDFQDGAHLEQQRKDLANDHVKYATAPVDDGHDSRHHVDDPYVVRNPKPIRRRLAPTSFRQTNDSVQTISQSWGGQGQAGHDGNKGIHFSMATNRRTYAIGGMQPVVSRRNTYRLVPPPVDINRNDYGPTGQKFDVPENVTVGTPVGLRSITARLR